MANFESNKTNEDKHPVQDTDQQQVNHGNTIVTASQRNKNMFGWKIVAVILIGVIALVYTSVDVEVTNSADILPIESIVIDERLLSCNKVVSGEPTDDFATCLSAAKDGNVLAINRIIWGYSRASEFQNWTEVFNWLKALPRKNENTQLLMFAIIHIMASSEELKKDSEIGISRLVAKNYPPANVFLASVYALEENVLPPTSNIQWLLERESNENYNTITPIQLLQIYANGLVGKIDIEKANEYLQQVTQRNYPVNANNIAWFLSTLDNNPFTTQEYALTLAKQVTDDPEHSQNPIYIDTLAAAFAANNRFDEAIEAQKLAIQLLSESEFSEQAKNARKPEFEARLALYEKGEALVEQSISIDRTVFFSLMKTRIIDLLFRDFYAVADVPTATENLNMDGETDEVDVNIDSETGEEEPEVE